MREVPFRPEPGNFPPQEFQAYLESSLVPSEYVDGYEELPPYAQAATGFPIPASRGPRETRPVADGSASNVFSITDVPAEAAPITDFGGVVPPTGTDYPREAAGDEPEPFGVARFDGYVPSNGELPAASRSVQTSVRSSLERFDEYLETGIQIGPDGVESASLVLLQHETEQGMVYFVVAKKGGYDLISAGFVNPTAKELLDSRQYARSPDGGVFKVNNKEYEEKRKGLSVLNLYDHGYSIESDTQNAPVGDWKLIGAAEADYITGMLAQAEPRRFCLEHLSSAVTDHQSSALELRSPTPEEVRNSAMYGQVFLRDTRRFLADRGWNGTPIVHTTEGEIDGRAVTLAITVLEKAEPDGLSTPLVDVRYTSTLTAEHKAMLESVAHGKYGDRLGQARSALYDDQFFVQKGVLVGLHQEGFGYEGGMAKGSNNYSYLGGAAIAKILRYLTRDEHPPLSYT
ncbi:MAG TPA: hypothetical protein VJP80_04805 [Candidatus Saccharimonadales bacterium]|nr:hypothetical protein [Candidatus Saccharimonadales bacterium]